MVALEKATGVVCIAAGTVWVAACLVHNLQPAGCIGEGCAGGGQMRSGSPLGLVLFLAAGALLAASLGGLLLLARRRLGHGRVGLVAGLTCVLALTTLLAATVVSTLVDGDWDGMPWLVGPGILLLALGTVMVAVTLWKARVVPRQLFGVVLATAVLLPFANEQTSLILLAVPFGLALAAVGVHLVRQLPAVSAPVEARAGELL
jgi:hypothetical protein